MSEDILDLHFGPKWHLPAPRTADARIAMSTILLYTQQPAPDVTYEHPHISADELVVDSWPDESIPE